MLRVQPTLHRHPGPPPGVQVQTPLLDHPDWQTAHLRMEVQLLLMMPLPPGAMVLKHPDLFLQLWRFLS
jgi:hypothetical protein